MPLQPEVGERRAHFLELERLDDGRHQLHAASPSSLAAQFAREQGSAPRRTQGGVAQLRVKRRARFEMAV